MPAGQLIRRILPELIHPDSLQALLHTLPDFLCGNAQIFRAKAHVLLNDLTDDLIIRVLENHTGLLADIPQIAFIRGVLAIYKNRSFRRIKNCIDMLGKCGLAGAIMPQNCHEVTLLYIQADLIHRPRNTLYIAFLISSDVFKNKLVCLYNSHLSSFINHCISRFCLSFIVQDIVSICNR